MDRLACVEVPQLALQLLLRREKSWRRLPAAVVAEDRPLAPVLAANGRARRAGVAAGMRYATALALAPELRAAPVAAAEVAAGVELVGRLLHAASPQVEPRVGEPGVFWVGATGLERLYGSLELWVEETLRRLRAEELAARAAVGFTRFGSYAAARSRGGPPVLASPEEERRAALAAPLAVLGLAPNLADRLGRLGVRTVEAFLRLPPGGLLRRYGPEAEAAHRFARGDLALPLQGEPPAEPLALTSRFAAAEDNRGRILLHASALLDRLLADLESGGELAAELTLSLGLERGGVLRESLQPAEPTRSRSLLLELLDLRLSSLELSSPVAQVSLDARRLKAEDAQQELFRKRPRRDSAAAARAFARLRAELGNGAVVRARPADEHLPEQQYVWEAVAAAEAGETGASAPAQAPVLVRRILEEPVSLGSRPLSGRLLGGPYAVSGGWWGRAAGEADREYYFAEAPGGRIEWLYRDLRTRSWVLQGYVD